MKVTIKGLAQATTVSLGILAGAGSAWADSAFGCRGLFGADAMPSLEGTGGHFYRIDPDLHADHRLEPGVVAQLAELTRILAARGTTLVYVPIPAKALVVPDHLPPEARDLGYDTDLAATIYELTLRDLRKAGVPVVDARHALRTTRGTEDPVFQTDPRITAAGAETLASAVAQVLAEAPGYARMNKALFQTRLQGTEILSSDMRMLLQDYCAAPLPLVAAERHATFKSARASAVSVTRSDTPLETADGIVVVGSDIAGLPASNFAGFLAAYSQLDTIPVIVPEGEGLVPLSSYLTSAAFDRAPPAFLVWTHPIWESLAAQGDQPMREVLAAAGTTCRTPLDLIVGRDGVGEADLSRVPADPRLTLRLDTAAAAQEVRFDFEGPDGLVRTRTLRRDPGHADTGRYYMPMSALWPEGPMRVTITLDTGFGRMPDLTLCDAEG